ncbi:hypothetical protein [Streptomyces sp. NPDC005322]|uniref:hypothetical protein n=1 Tax=Streptomyces sp. NPDC005322 TaxID=3157032 RepID=UPI0033A1F978
MTEGGTVVLGQVLAGMGGVGTTQLAANRARAAWDRDEVDLLVWVTAATRTSVAAYAQAATDLLGADPADPERAASAFLASLCRLRAAAPARQGPGAPAHRRAGGLLARRLSPDADPARTGQHRDHARAAHGPGPRSRRSRGATHSRPRGRRRLATHATFCGIGLALFAAAAARGTSMRSGDGAPSSPSSPAPATATPATATPATAASVSATRTPSPAASSATSAASCATSTVTVPPARERDDDQDHESRDKHGRGKGKRQHCDD